jgi:antitoxin component YwqK of YwqJK toxin-antitoxin module
MSIFKILFGVLIFIAFGVIEANAIDQSICSPGEKVVLYPNGSLKSCALKDDLRLDEIKCKSQNSISFYNNGQLETCVLAESAKVSGQDCREAGLTSFYPDGKFKSCVKKD